MEAHTNEILTFLLQSAAGAIGVLAFIGLAPAKLGEKFFGHYLDRRLEALKHDQNQKIEELRAGLALMGDRGIRSNEKEFQAISAAWEDFLDAYGATMQCAVAFIQHPDLQRLSEEELNQYLETNDLSDRQREEIMNAPNKNKAFSRLIEIKQINDAGLAIYKARNLIRKQAIFMPDSLLNDFEKMMKRLSAAQIQRSIEPHYGAYQQKEVEWLIVNGENERASLLAAVRQRIFRQDN